MARVGKIARLPADLREQLNLKLLAGDPASRILPWLNALPETKAALEADFEGLLVNDENLSHWRKGEYQVWLERRDKLARIRELSHFAVKLAEANGGSLAEGGAAIASGRLLELLEATDGKMNPEDLGSVIKGLVDLRSSDVATKRLELAQEKLKRIDEQLALDKARFHRQTTELFLKWYQNESARRIASSPISFTDKVETLGQQMWGDLWQLQQTAPKP